jgi:hypothetical protein
MKASRWFKIGALVVAVLVGLLLALRVSPVGAQAEVAVGYGARTACACRYLGLRSLASCRTDFEPGMEMVRLSEDPVEKRVTAAVPLIAARSARFEPEYGCTLEDD